MRDIRGARDPESPARRRSDEEEFEGMLRRLSELRRDLAARWAEIAPEFAQLGRESRASARNLVHYLALRRHDLRPLQNHLSRHGISSLGRAESYVMSNIDKVLKLLHRLLLLPRPPEPEAAAAAGVSFADGRMILKRRTETLLGAPPLPRRVYIMVTLPREAAEDYELVRGLIAGGMDCARINCAHDAPDDWKRMTENIRRAEKEAGRRCKICFDIAGPKLRTGALEAGPRVIKLRPARDLFGGVTAPARVWLTSAEKPALPPSSSPSPDAPFVTLRLARDFLRRLEAGDEIRFKDARGASRFLLVREIAGRRAGVWAEIRKTAYVTPDTEFKIGRRRGAGGERPVSRASGIPALEQSVLLRKGDSLILSADPAPGRPVLTNARGEILEPSRIPCTLPEVFRDVRPGERIWFDDGRIGGVVGAVRPGELHVRITQAGARGERLRADKGINLPDSDLRLPSLTPKDLTDLKFVVRHADFIGYSFVRSAADVRALQKKLKELKAPDPGIVLKIETRRGFERLPEILLAALGSPAVGVMIARGDLAVETGFERMAEVQEEILWMSEAAHVPVIWATQVLEQLSKSGVHSRAEITDAAMSERAECVMLNKGPFILEAVRALDDILTRMQAHHDKKRSMLRRLRLAEEFFEVRERRAPGARKKQKEVPGATAAGRRPEKI